MTLKDILVGLFSQIRSIWFIGTRVFYKRETQMYPEKKVKLSQRYRGRIVLTRNKVGEERCVACNLCAAVCPVGCISLQKAQMKNKRWYPKFFRINFSRCIFCGLCEEACPTAAIQLVPDFELGEFKRQDLIYEKKDLLILGQGKYLDYNFYEFCGVQLTDQKTDHRKNKDNNRIDIKTLLP